MKHSILYPALLVLGILSMEGCKEDEVPFDVKVAQSSTLGEFLTDGHGNSLYFFSAGSQCTGNCRTNWPIFLKEGNLHLPANLDAADFQTLLRDDGLAQTTYKGRPLYYYREDAKPGDTKGENVNNSWFVAKKDYSVFYVKNGLLGHDGNSYLPKYDLTAYTKCGGSGEPACVETLYLTTSEGRTLYSFKNDRHNTNNYTGPATLWVPFHTDLATLTVPSVFNKSDFGEIIKNDVKQLTYKGWPLYKFGGNANATPPIPGDEIPGQTRGVSFPTPGVWPIVNTETQAAPN